MRSRLIRSCIVLLLVAAVCAPAAPGGASPASAQTLPAEVDNFTWVSAASPVTANLNSVAVVSADDAWAVGVNGTVLHYDGDSWAVSSTPIPETTALFSVAMSSAQNGWIVSGDSLFRWDGTQWSSFTTPSPPWPFYMQDISVPNDTSAWVTGGIFVCSSGPPCDPENALGTISHWDGSSWSNTSISNAFFSAISMISDSDGWVVGLHLDPASGNLRSLILRWNGSYWATVDHPVTEYPGGSVHYILEDVAALNPQIAWTAVSGQNRFLRWDGNSWMELISPVSGRPSIAVLSADNAWAVGAEGDIGHWNGHFWTQVPSSVSVTLSSISMASPFEGWAVGEGGVILHGSMPAMQTYLPCVSR
ncbi:MAG: hypothetical protein GYA20_11890 [Chloroflexi bacterium]|nr:hypothetical protein [Chloroflexota bacterium]